MKDLIRRKVSPNAMDIYPSQDGSLSEKAKGLLVFLQRLGIDLRFEEQMALAALPREETYNESLKWTEEEYVPLASCLRDGHAYNRAQAIWLYRGLSNDGTLDDLTRYRRIKIDLVRRAIVERLTVEQIYALMEHPEEGRDFARAYVVDLDAFHRDMIHRIQLKPDNPPAANPKKIQIAEPEHPADPIRFERQHRWFWWPMAVAIVALLIALVVRYIGSTT